MQLPDRCVQHGRDAHFLEGIGEIGGDGKGAAQTDDVDDPGLRQHANGCFKLLRIDSFQNVFERRTARIHELGQKQRAAIFAIVPQVAEPRRVIRPAAAGIVFAKQALHVRKTGKTHDLAEAHDGRRLDASTFRQFSDCGHRDAVGMRSDVIGALTKTFRQAAAYLQQTLPKSFDRGRCRIVAHDIPLIFSIPMTIWNIHSKKNHKHSMTIHRVTVKARHGIGTPNLQLIG